MSPLLYLSEKFNELAEAFAGEALTTTEIRTLLPEDASLVDVWAVIDTALEQGVVTKWVHAADLRYPSQGSVVKYRFTGKKLQV